MSVYHPRVQVRRVPADQPEWTLKCLNDETAEITEYAGQAERLTIPQQIDGWRIITIGKDAFRNCPALTTVVLPEGLTCLGKYVFRDCKALQRVVLPSTLEDIRAYAFLNCPALKEIALPDGLRSVQPHAFFGCTGLARMELPRAMRKCRCHFMAPGAPLREILAWPGQSVMGEPASCVVIRREAPLPGFAYTADYKYQILHNGTVRLVHYRRKDEMQRIVVPAEIDGFPVAELGRHLFIHIPEQGEVVIPEGVQVIKRHALTGGGYKVTLPGSIRKMEPHAFVGRKVDVTGGEEPCCRLDCEEMAHC